MFGNWTTPWHSSKVGNKDTLVEFLDKIQDTELHLNVIQTMNDDVLGILVHLGQTPAKTLL